MARPFSKFMARFHGSLASRLTAAVLLGAFAMLAVVGGCSYFAMSRLMARNIQHELHSELATVSRLLEESLGHFDRHLAGNAGSPFVTNALVDSEGRHLYLRPFLEDQLHDVHHLLSLTLVDFRGRPVMSAATAAEMAPFLDRTVLYPLLSREGGTARIVREDGRLTVLLLHPVVFPQTGTVEGALVGQVDLAALFEERIAIFPPKFLHRLLSGPEILLAAHQRLPAGDLFSLIRPLKLDGSGATLDLRVELGLSRAEVLSPLRQFIPAYLALGAFLMLLAYAMSRALGQHLARPIVELSRATEAIAAGDQETLPVEQRSHDEIGVLAGSFAALLEQLQIANRALQERVRRQTDSLRSSRELLANIVENIPLAVGVWELGARDYRVLWNRTARRIFGEQLPAGAGDLDAPSLLPLPLPQDRLLPGDEDEVWSFTDTWRHPETKREVLLESRVLGLFDEKGRNTHLVFIGDDVTERRRREDLVLRIARGVVTRTGEEFFTHLTEHLAGALGADFVLVGELKDTAVVETIATWADGRAIDNFAYDLHGTPCENALQGGTCSYPGNVAGLFPEDTMLAEMGIEAYVGSPLYDHEGAPLGVLVVLFRHPLEQPGTIESVLQIFAARCSGELVRRRYERDLGQNREWLRSIFENAFSGICTVALDGSITAANGTMLGMLGIREEEFPALRLEEIFHPDDWLATHREFHDLRSGFTEAVRREARLQRRDGSHLWVEMAFTCSGRDRSWPEFAIGIFQDISERRQVERAVHLDKVRFEALYRLSQMLEEPEKMVKDYALEEAVRITGSAIGYLYLVDEQEERLTLHAWSGQVMDQCTVEGPPTEYELAHTGLWGEALRQRRPVVTNDYRADNPWKKGLPEGHVPLTRHLNLPLIVGGKAVLVAGVGNKDEPYDESDVRHLTLIMDGMWRCLQHRRAEQALRGSELRYRELSGQFEALLEGIPDHITLLRPGLKVAWSNHAAGGGTPAWKGEGFCYQLWHEEAEICSDCPPARAFASGRLEQGQIETGDGRTWDLRAIPILAENGQVSGVIELAQDITERIRAQEQSIRTAHLASLGELAAGVAHEINNPVNGVINYAQILADRLREDASLADLGQRIMREGERISHIVRSLLDFARPQDAEKTLVDPAAELRDSLALNAAQLRRSGIEWRLEVAPDLPRVRANAGQLRQVCLNILSNARQALEEKFPGGGAGESLDIRLERIAGPPERVRLTVVDYGTGIAEEDLERIMNPFFTTKSPGKGTGLGLSISHGIVADHGGTLRIDSVQGEFTRVRIDLPAAAGRR